MKLQPSKLIEIEMFFDFEFFFRKKRKCYITTIDPILESFAQAWQLCHLDMHKMVSDN